MGDRGNIVVRDEDEQDIWLYTHWGGSEINDVLLKVMTRRQRWDDAPYLARMIFCEMTRGAETGETGFGISTRMCDNEHDILVVDVGRQLIFRAVESRDVKKGVLDAGASGGFRGPKSFEDFVKTGGIPEEGGRP